MQTCPPGAPRRESSCDRRLAIALAARGLIIEKGLEGLRTRDIAERVGINIATLHYHVPTKEALVALVAESIRDEFKAQSLRRPRAHLPPAIQFEMELEDFRETLIESPDMVLVFSEMLDRSRRDAQVAEVMRPLYDYWLGQFEAIFEGGRKDGSFHPDIDPLSAARLVTGGLSDFWRRSARDLPAYDRLAGEIRRAVRNPYISKDEISHAR